MKLWTFQSLEAVEQLEQEGKLYSLWDRYSTRDFFTLSYRWMIKQMQRRGMNCGGYAPLWAWHSCGAYGGPPTKHTASNLLSLLQIEAGIKLITFECPNERVLLSNYGPWNDIIDLFIDHRSHAVVDQALENRLFDIPAVIEDYESIQACLPYLLMDWVIDIELLDMRGYL